MNKFLIAALATAAILPSAAMARPSDRPVRHDTRVVVIDQRHAPVHAQASAVWHKPVVAKRIAVGQRIEPGFIARYDTVKKPARYHLKRTNANTRWLKVRDDAVMVNLRTGRVLDIAYNIFR